MLQQLKVTTTITFEKLQKKRPCSKRRHALAIDDETPNPDEHNDTVESGNQEVHLQTNPNSAGRETNS